MLYFAYGSNLLHERLSKRCPSAEVVANYTLKGWKFVFNKVSRDGSTKANIIHTQSPDDSVEGVVYYIARHDKPSLDRVEGNRVHYNIVRQRTELGHLFFYVAKRNLDNDILPYTWYKDIIVQGMQEHNINATAVQRHNAQVDLDMRRTYRNLAVTIGSESLLNIAMDTDSDNTLSLLYNYTAGMLVRKHIIMPKFFRQANNVKQAMLESLHTALCELFNVEVDLVCDLNTVDALNTGGGVYVRGKIILNKLSLMTYIHEFGHALQFAGVNLTQADDIEVEAREWSHSVFFIATPHMYFKAVEEGKFHHDDVRLVRPLSDEEGNPANNVLRNRFYAYFDVFVAYVKAGNTPAFTEDDLAIVVNGHASLQRHADAVLKAA